jgi:hypothetical protein
MREKHGNVVMFVGGSTTAFGIDAAALEREGGIPAVNLAMHAGLGPVFLTGMGLTQVEQGDTLVLALEPSFLQGPIESKLFGLQMALLLERPKTVTWYRGGPTLAEWLSALRPGAYHVFTMLGKLAMGKPLYRYSMEDYREGGWLVTNVRVPVGGGAGGESEEAVENDQQHLLSADGVDFLKRVREEVEARGGSVVYLLPWSYVSSEHVGRARRQNARLLDEIEQILPVIREETLGAHSVAEDFADTSMHLTEEAAQRRTRALMQQQRMRNL